ncbi:type II toxin-antitoxin system HicB family antitoxin [Vibrio vulnificus]|uniref:type II toxin-antitoxin system HicB family antitoxin n=1 Tax=Vibrio vulnificus TaxID=672 RepID=UPI000D73E06D|nr:type II toxin-antitoxin system HicB family antitoxin [Vibrio vulnificus]MCJ0823788.1 type II toxin-antitoxin system HicB family antitoxin [Vibrio vulnificus]PWY27633.1 CopG family transcriptional regulator [Vibrio vulnificus]HBH7894724.1 type II toxin-antitoxin system HicB family antitoxin [Vibrio vulnificus]HDY8141398.1 type II toxin-antitoxin system HicB family antitoxin [Vibrio vulnificus]HDY8220343.1 type II toxin-antitoxin system HicB family antitoxin [Vibrio vulnificus]
MWFTLGVETPKNKDSSYGIVVPALCNDRYSCYSASDSSKEIAAHSAEAIESILEEMLADGFDVLGLEDQGALAYREDEAYRFCDVWLQIEIDVSRYSGKSQRVNISLPESLLAVIDRKVENSDLYRDRSHFLAIAARNELC